MIPIAMLSLAYVVFLPLIIVNFLSATQWHPGQFQTLFHLFHLILGVSGSCPKVGSHHQMKRALLKRAALGFQPYIASS